MKLTVAPEIFEEFPDFELGIVAARGVDNRGADREIEAFLRHALLEAGLLLKLKPVDKDPTVAFYRDLLAKMGAAEAVPSMEARLSEVAAGIAAETGADASFAPGQTAGLVGVTAIRRLSPIADLARGAEIQFRLPVFAFDMETEEVLSVRKAFPDDRFETEVGAVSVSEKEAIFAFGNRVAVRYLFCAQSGAGAVTARTRDVLIAIPCFAPSRRRAMSARNEIARRIKDSFGRDTEADWLSSVAPDFVSGL